MMTITSTELRKHLYFYLEKANDEDVYISKYGKIVAVLISPIKAKEKHIDSLLGKYNPEGVEIDYDRLLEERILEKHLS